MLPREILAKVAAFLTVRELCGFRVASKEMERAVRENTSASFALEWRLPIHAWESLRPDVFGQRFLSVRVSRCNMNQDFFALLLERNGPYLRSIEVEKAPVLPQTIGLEILSRPELFPQLERLAVGGFQGMSMGARHIVSDVVHSVLYKPPFKELKVLALVNTTITLQILVDLCAWLPLEALFLCGTTISGSLEPGVIKSCKTLKTMEVTFVDKNKLQLLKESLDLSCNFVDFTEPEMIPEGTKWMGPQGSACAKVALAGRDKYGRTPLHFLATEDSSRDVPRPVHEYRKLLALGAQIDLRDTKSRTVVYVACQYNNDALLRACAEREGDDLLNSMYLRTIRGETALYIAALRGSVECVRTLCGVIDNYVHGFQKSRRPSKRREILSSLYNSDRWTPLHASSIGGHVKCLLRLLDVGFLVEAKTKDDDSPLHVACFGGHVHCIEILMERGARIDAQAESIASRASKTLCAAFVRKVLTDNGQPVASDEALARPSRRRRRRRRRHHNFSNKTHTSNSNQNTRKGKV